MARARTLVQVVDVLGNHRDVVIVLQTADDAVALIGLRRIEFLSEHIIEIGDERRVGFPSFVRRHLLYGVILPETIVAAKGLETALHRHAGTGKKHYLLHCSIGLRHGRAP